LKAAFLSAFSSPQILHMNNPCVLLVTLIYNIRVSIDDVQLLPTGPPLL
jgi:hypothetical protein